MTITDEATIPVVREADLPPGGFHVVADFLGTPEQAEANRRTHSLVVEWDPMEGERCAGCDCRGGSRIMDYPCGEPVDRIAIYSDGTKLRYTEGRGYSR